MKKQLGNVSKERGEKGRPIWLVDLFVYTEYMECVMKLNGTIRSIDS